MDEQQTVAQTCPTCGSADYAFRGRKKIPANADQQGQEVMETKYRCKTCSHEWKNRVGVER